MSVLGIKDQQLIYELEKDARKPLSLIAKRLRISKQLLSYKIKQLEKKGIIQGYHAIIDTSRLGFTSYRVYLKYQHCTLEKKQEIINYLIGLPEVTILVSIDGLWDIGFLVMVKKIHDFHDFWKKIMIYREFIDRFHISIYSPIYHFTRTFLNPKENEMPIVRVLGGKEIAEFDELDVKILTELAPNVRKPLLEIAQKLDKSLQLVINRIKLLEKKGIIQGYRPILNNSKLGYEYYKVDITLSSHKRYEEIFAFSKQHKYIFQVDYTIGGSDFEIEIYARNRTHLKEIMQDLQNRFKTEFKNYIYFTVEKTHKETFFPT